VYKSVQKCRKAESGWKWCGKGEAAENVDNGVKGVPNKMFTFADQLLHNEFAI